MYIHTHIYTSEFSFKNGFSLCSVHRIVCCITRVVRSVTRKARVRSADLIKEEICKHRANIPLLSTNSSNCISFLSKSNNS